MPRLDDDGATVTLDLHGATVPEAEALALRVVAEAARRGRSEVRLIHGTSTSSRLYRNRTIKHALHALLADSAFDAWITGELESESVLTLTLDLTVARDPRPLRLLDLRPR